jgi:3-isopropylmalate/(R)-2-methylmalate dehydratase small subunit
MLPAMLPEDTCAALREQLRATPGAQIAIDLEKQTITDVNGIAHRFQIDAVYKERLLKGLDEVGLVLQHLSEIEAFEQRHHSEHRWLA